MAIDRIEWLSIEQNCYRLKRLAINRTEGLLKEQKNYFFVISSGRKAEDSSPTEEEPPTQNHPHAIESTTAADTQAARETRRGEIPQKLEVGGSLAARLCTCTRTLYRVLLSLLFECKVVHADLLEREIWRW